MKKLNIAIIGQGRSGKDIHGAYLLSERNDLFTVKYVVERDERRRKISAERYPGCEVLSEYIELFPKTDVDLVVNASFSREHYPVTLDLLRHGFNVLSEKPFAATAAECDDLIRTAKERGVVLGVFHNTVPTPYVEKIKETMTDGKIGKVLSVSLRWNGFSRRWDWQTLQKMTAGNAYNTGPHPFSIACEVLNYDPEMKVTFSKLYTSKMSSGDADDFCKVIVTAPGKPFVDIEINNTDAYTPYNVLIQGEKGTFRCTTADYEMQYLADGENPPRPVSEKFLEDENGNPLYCGENLVKREEKGKFEGDAFTVGADGIYRGMYAAITAGTPLTVTPEKARAVIALIEEVHRQNPLEKKY